MDRDILSTEKIVSDMNKRQLSRWISLFEAVNIIADNAEEFGISIKDLTLKKPPLDMYIKQTSDIVYRELSNKIERVD